MACRNGGSVRMGDVLAPLASASWHIAGRARARDGTLSSLTLRS